MLDKSRPLNYKAELERNLQERDVRNEKLKELDQRLIKANLEIARINKEKDFVMQIKEVEQRIVTLLNYLVQYPHEEKEFLLKSELASKELLVKVLEDIYQLEDACTPS